MLPVYHVSAVYTSAPEPSSPVARKKPKAKYISSESDIQHDHSNAFTTVMLRNCPNDLKRDLLMRLLDQGGFCRCYDFVYLPVDFQRVAGLGYAFVNFTSNDDAIRAMNYFEGFSDWPVVSPKVCAVSWGQPLQGLSHHIERYRNSPVMHEDVPDQFKPVLLKDGVRLRFPAATKKLRLPRMKRSSLGVPSSCPGFVASDSEEDVPVLQ